jgi:hypothetical protein
VLPPANAASCFAGVGVSGGVLVGEVAGGVDVGQLPLASGFEPPGHVGIIWIKPPPAPVVLPGYTGSDRVVGVQISSS